MDCFIGIVIVGGVAVGGTIFYFKKFVIPKLLQKPSKGTSGRGGEDVGKEDPTKDTD